MCVSNWFQLVMTSLADHIHPAFQRAVCVFNIFTVCQFVDSALTQFIIV